MLSTPGYCEQRRISLLNYWNDSVLCASTRMKYCNVVSGRCEAAGTLKGNKVGAPRRLIPAKVHLSLEDFSFCRPFSFTSAFPSSLSHQIDTFPRQTTTSRYCPSIYGNAICYRRQEDDRCLRTWRSRGGCSWANGPRNSCLDGGYWGMVLSFLRLWLGEW
jgi:hypothetical protein